VIILWTYAIYAPAHGEKALIVEPVFENIIYGLFDRKDWSAQIAREAVS